jgi:N-acyl-D-aspartate/D-glutamate deacylase
MVCNLAPLVGHNTVLTAAATREAAGPGAQLSPTRAVEEALEQGAVGVSTGLIYPPGCTADLQELVRFAAPAAGRGLPYCTHIRNEASGLSAAVEEALKVGQRSGAAVHISHLKVAGRPNWSTLVPVVERLREARAAGLDVTADAYPYTAGSTALAAMLPPWLEAEGTERMLDQLTKPAVRNRLAGEIAAGLPGWPNPVGDDGWSNVVVAAAADTPEAEGHTLAELGGGDDRGALDAGCELLLANRGAVTVIIHAMSQRNVDLVLAQPFVMLGSDGIPLPGRPHPRLAGTFARWLGHYVRERRMIDLPAAVHRVTGLTARRFRLRDRGHIAPGYVADLAVIQPETVRDNATYEAPMLPPAGVWHVFIAGRPVIRDGCFTGAHAGRVLAPS